MRAQRVDAGTEVGEHKRGLGGDKEPVSCQINRGTVIGRGFRQEREHHVR